MHHGLRRELRALDEQKKLLVIGLMMESPSLYPEELCKEVQFLTSIVVSPATICTILAIWRDKEMNAPSCNAEK